MTLTNSEHMGEKINAVNYFNKYWWVFLLIIGVWALTWLLPLFTQSSLFIGNKLGAFGDMFGSVNALFSGLALAGIIITLILQKTELKLQRDELTLTRKELKRSAEAQQSSVLLQKDIAELNARATIIQYLLALRAETGDSLLPKDDPDRRTQLDALEQTGQGLAKNAEAIGRILDRIVTSRD